MSEISSYLLKEDSFSVFSNNLQNYFRKCLLNYHSQKLAADAIDKRIGSTDVERMEVIKQLKELFRITLIVRSRPPHHKIFS